MAGNVVNPTNAPVKAGVTPGSEVVKAASSKMNQNAENKGVKSAKEAENVPVDPNAGKEKYIVDDKEVYLTPEESKAYVQKGLAFEPKVSQLSRLQQETGAFLSALEKDPASVIYNEKFGKPHEVLARILNSTKVSDEIKETLGQWYYNNVIVQEKMTPQEREVQEYKRKAQEYDQYRQSQEAARIQQENEVKTQQALGEIKARINEAMADSGIPIGSKIAPQIVKRIAQIMQLGYVTGKTITPKEAMAKAKAEVAEYRKAWLDALDEDRLVEELGKENAEKVRKYYLKQVRAKEAGVKPPHNSPSPKRDVRNTMTPDQFREYLDGLKSGK